MACFLVPAGEAIVATVVKKVEEKKEVTSEKKEEVKIPFSQKLKWLTSLLWGGAILLAFEHLWHGEVVPFFPFLTAVADGETAGMLQEMGTAGVSMAGLVTLIWGVMVAVTSAMEKKALNSDNTVKEGV